MTTRLGLGCLVLAWAGAAHAAVTNADTGLQYATIGVALAAASSGDTLVLDPGVYAEQVTVDRTIAIDGGGAATITAGTGNGVIDVLPTHTLTLTGVTLSSASVRGINAQTNATLTLDDVLFQTTTIADGGGIFATSTAGMALTDVTFDGTSAAFDGGAIKVAAGAPVPVTLTDVTFDATSAGSKGGAIAADTVDLVCTRCTFDATTAVTGGALYADNGGTYTLVDSELHGTTASAGGGVYADVGVASVTVSRSLFCGTNAAFTGGAVESLVPVTMTNTRIVETAAGTGAGLYLRGGSSSVVNNTLVGIQGDGVTVTGAGVTATVVDNQLSDITGFALLFAGATSPAISYNLFWANASDLSGEFFNLGNVTGQPPDVVAYSLDGDCSNDALWPLAPDSALLDAGDFAITDTDGSRADIGYAGGPGADPLFHGDADADGSIWLEDCDDDDALRTPGAGEVCDLVDNDCDQVVDEGATDMDRWYLDCDGDGQGGALSEVLACFEPAAVAGCVWMSLATFGNDAWFDCDDADADVYFGADEYCLAGDQSCNGEDDEIAAVDRDTYYDDGDGDGFGAAVHLSCSQSPPLGTSTVGGDCDDGAGTTYPGATDPCGDAVDSDCNGADGVVLLTFYADLDADGYGDPANDTQDCGDLTGQGYTDASLATDCDDDDPDRNPSVTEVCNLVDDDCDDQVDDVGPDVTWYEDQDGDAYGTNPVTDDCAPISGGPWITTGDDCDDRDADVNPDALETCNDQDDDCDGFTDASDPDAVGTYEAWPDWDGDGYGTCADGAPPCDGEIVCPGEPDTADNNLDCDDGSPEIYPGSTEITGNAVDEDCDGVAAGAPDTGTTDTDTRTSDQPGGDGGGSDGCNCGHGPAPTAPWLLGLALLAVRSRR